MNSFHWPRFRHVLANDFLQQWKRIWITTLALAGIGLIAYLTNVDPRAAERPEIYLALFPGVLVISGLLFTSAIFADLHHPLQRFHYLTLPNSNLERFVSRYLLSGPLFCLYVVIAYSVFDWLAALIAEATIGASAVRFTPLDESARETMLTYLWLHALVFGGAIYFRSHALIKTLLVGGFVSLALIAVSLAAVRIVFWDYFTSVVQMEPERSMRLLAVPRPIVSALGIAFVLWVLFIAYQALREHEVQGEV